MKRIFSFLIDLGLAACAILSIMTLCHNQNTVVILSMCVLALFYCRDCITGQSIGHRIMGICVIYKAHPVSSWRALIRNLFLLIWPIELIFFIFNNQKRLGDMVAHTLVFSSPGIAVHIRISGLLIYAIMWIGFSLVAFLFMTNESRMLIYL